MTIPNPGHSLHLVPSFCPLWTLCAGPLPSVPTLSPLFCSLVPLCAHLYPLPGPSVHPLSAPPTHFSFVPTLSPSFCPPWHPSLYSPFDPTTLCDFKSHICHNFAGPGPYPTVVLPQTNPAPFVVWPLSPPSLAPPSALPGSSHPVPLPLCTFLAPLPTLLPPPSPHSALLVPWPSLHPPHPLCTLLVHPPLSSANAVRCIHI